MVRYWEWEGGRTILRAYREAKWQYEKWKKLCRLGGLEIGEGKWNSVKYEKIVKKIMGAELEKLEFIEGEMKREEYNRGGFR